MDMTRYHSDWVEIDKSHMEYKLLEESITILEIGVGKQSKTWGHCAGMNTNIEETHQRTTVSKILEVTFERHPSLRSGTSVERTAEEKTHSTFETHANLIKKIIFIEQNKHNWRSFEL